MGRVRRGVRGVRAGYVWLFIAHAQIRNRALPFDGAADAIDHPPHRRVIQRDDDQIRGGQLLRGVPQPALGGERGGGDAARVHGG